IEQQAEILGLDRSEHIDTPKVVRQFPLIESAESRPIFREAMPASSTPWVITQMLVLVDRIHVRRSDPWIGNKCLGHHLPRTSYGRQCVVHQVHEDGLKAKELVAGMLDDLCLGRRTD